MTTSTEFQTPRVGQMPRLVRLGLEGMLQHIVQRGVRTGLQLVNGRARWFVRLEEAGLLTAARRRAKCGTFADTTFLDGLRHLLHSLDNEAHLNFFGRIAAREDIVRLLVNRLRLERDRHRHPEIGAEQIREPIFITGLPRSGSTLLHGLFAQDPENRVPQSWEMLDPSPPPQRATYDRDPRIAAAERQMRWFQLLAPEFRKIHAVGAQFPEECVMILAHSFLGSEFCSMFGVPSYQAWLDKQDLVPAYRLHRYFLQHLQWHCSGARWVLKAPAHLSGLGALFTVYPDARVIMTHREPLEVLASEASLQVTLRKTFSEATDQIAIGREVTKGLSDAIDRGLRVRDSGGVNPEHFLDVSYTDLENDPIGTVRRIYARFDLRLTPVVEDRMQHFLAANPKDKHGPHEYALADFGLAADEEAARYRAYRERFSL